LLGGLYKADTGNHSHKVTSALNACRLEGACGQGRHSRWNVFQIL
jgi:hypothetical protein